MSEPTDLDQIAALEERITSALDRIAHGVAARKAAPPEGSEEDRAEMVERLAALGAALEETQAALASEQTTHAELSDRLRAVEAAREADADEAARELAKAREAASAAPADAPPPDEEALSALEAEVQRRQEVEDVLRRRIQRLREERNGYRAERTEAKEQLDEVQGRLDQLEAVAGPGGGGAAREMTRLRQSNRALRDTIEEMREGIGNDAVANSDLVTAALAAELESLRAERAADAAEAQAILAEIRPVLDAGEANA